MNKEGDPEPIVFALKIDDAALADRKAALLADVPGIRLAGPGEVTDVVRTLPKSPASDENAPLTARELEVLAIMAEGASNKMIARRLGISIHTAKFHVGSLLDKLDAIGRTDAVAHAVRLGVIHL